MSDMSSIYRQAGDLVTRKVGDEAVVVPVRNRVGDLDSIYTLNEVARRIWELLDGKTRVDAIVARICEEFEVTPEEASADAGDLLRTLADAGLVVAVEG